MCRSMVCGGVYRLQLSIQDHHDSQRFFLSGPMPKTYQVVHFWLEIWMEDWDVAQLMNTGVSPHQFRD